MEEINQKKLFDLVMKNNWEGVVNTYKDTKLYVAIPEERGGIPEEREGIHIAKITSSGDTALHIAVSNGREDIVELIF